MTQAAIPQYVKNHSLVDCAPGHRFSLYFDGWNDKWEVAEGEKASGLRRLLSLNDGKDLLVHLRQRQAVLADGIPDDRCLVVDALSTSPFATGLGNEHPIENGFAFLTPYGLPYLAASGVKGVLRRAAEELERDGKPGITKTAVEALFGPEDPASTDEGPALADDKRRRGALTFWDVLPEPARDRLVVEIMTPHFGDYYQGKSSPHDAGQPNPIPFLAVPAGSRFRFVVTFEPAYVPAGIAPFDWKSVVSNALEFAFGWLGFGAKTSVGYGALIEDSDAAAERARRVQESAAAARLASLSEQARQIEALRARFEKHAGRKQANSGVLYAETQKLIKAAIEGHWGIVDKNTLAELVANMGYAKIDFGSKEKEIRRAIRQLRGQS